MNLQFDGNRYAGCPRLGDNNNTIQAKLEELLSKMASEEINVVSCSRTDKGVHAKSKFYKYIIDNSKYQDVFTRKFTTHIPGKLNKQRGRLFL